MFYTDKRETLLSEMDGRCPEVSEAFGTALSEELEALLEANADWEIILQSDIRENRKDLVRADRAEMQKNRLRIRELKKILSEQRKRGQSFDKEEAVA